ncbi:MAG: nickel pincer cofactor biosynthesis protein LarC, partial [Thermoproteota archaeon]
ISDSINTLVNAEAKVHGRSINEVHLHEAGSVDTPAEIVGAAIALEDLNLFDTKVCSTPVAVGGGLFRFSHGTVSSPAPATIEILRSKGFPVIGGPIESELATPTGASLLVNLAQEANRFYPLMKPTAIGYGAGTKDFVEMPNVLRFTFGEFLDYQLLRDEISVLETNLDDVAGEIVGHTVDRLLQEGARDVSVIPMFTKKNRPGQILKIIADKTNAERLSRVLIEETGTLGVRVYPCQRHILSRESIVMDIQVDDVKEFVNVKVAKDGKGEIVQIKPEYDDVERIAQKTDKPLREIMELVKRKAREVLLKR